MPSIKILVLLWFPLALCNPTGLGQPGTSDLSPSLQRRAPALRFLSKRGSKEEKQTHSAWGEMDLHPTFTAEKNNKSYNGVTMLHTPKHHKKKVPRFLIKRSPEEAKHSTLGELRPHPSFGPDPTFEAAQNASNAVTLLDNSQDDKKKVASLNNTATDTHKKNGGADPLSETPTNDDPKKEKESLTPEQKKQAKIEAQKKKVEKLQKKYEQAKAKLERLQSGKDQKDEKTSDDDKQHGHKGHKKVESEKHSDLTDDKGNATDDKEKKKGHKKSTTDNKLNGFNGNTTTENGN